MSDCFIPLFIPLFGALCDSRSLLLQSGYGTGSEVWPSGKVFADLVARSPTLLEGRAVLELGSGTGVLGICAALSCTNRRHPQPPAPTVADKNDDRGDGNRNHNNNSGSNNNPNHNSNHNRNNNDDDTNSNNNDDDTNNNRNNCNSSNHRGDNDNNAAQPPPLVLAPASFLRRLCLTDYLETVLHNLRHNVRVNGLELATAAAAAASGTAVRTTAVTSCSASSVRSPQQAQGRHDDCGTRSSSSSSSGDDSGCSLGGGGGGGCARPLQVEVEFLDWGDRRSKFPLHEFDTIIASDLIADPLAAELLCGLLRRFLRRRGRDENDAPTTTTVVVDGSRGSGGGGGGGGGSSSGGGGGGAGGSGGGGGGKHHPELPLRCKTARRQAFLMLQRRQESTYEKFCLDAVAAGLRVEVLQEFADAVFMMHVVRDPRRRSRHRSNGRHHAHGGPGVNAGDELAHEDEDNEEEKVVEAEEAEEQATKMEDTEERRS